MSTELVLSLAVSLVCRWHVADTSLAVSLVMTQATKQTKQPLQSFSSSRPYQNTLRRKTRLTGDCSAF